MIERLGFFGDPEIVGACQERFAAFVKDPAALPPDIRHAVCDVVGHYADAPTYDALLAQANKAGSDEQKQLFYGALAQAADPTLAQETLNLAIQEDMPNNYLYPLLGGVANAGEHPDLETKFIRANLLVPRAYEAFNDAGQADELENYARQPGAVADPTQVKKSAESIRATADLKARALPEISRWLKG